MRLRRLFGDPNTAVRAVSAGILSLTPLCCYCNNNVLIAPCPSRPPFSWSSVVSVGLLTGARPLGRLAAFGKSRYVLSVVDPRLYLHLSYHTMATSSSTKKLCDCTLRCGGGKLVSKSTYYAHSVFRKNAPPRFVSQAMRRLVGDRPGDPLVAGSSSDEARAPKRARTEEVSVIFTLCITKYQTPM